MGTPDDPEDAIRLVVLEGGGAERPPLMSEMDARETVARVRLLAEDVLRLVESDPGVDAQALFEMTLVSIVELTDG